MNHCISRGNLAFCCVIVTLLSTFNNACAQFDSLGIKTKWSKGSIVLKENIALQGEIQFNDKLGMISFKENPGDQPETFAETNIMSMKFYDESVERWRHFGTFNINVAEEGREIRMLFEILIEFENFALLSRIERVNIATRTHTDYFTGMTSTNKVGYEQFEKFVLVDVAGVATVVLVVNELERDKLALAGKTKPYLDKPAIEKYLKEDWGKFQTIVKTNKLDLKKREDFLAAFDKFHQAQ